MSLTMTITGIFLIFMCAISLYSAYMAYTLDSGRWAIIAFMCHGLLGSESLNAFFKGLNGW